MTKFEIKNEKNTDDKQEIIAEGEKRMVEGRGAKRCLDIVAASVSFVNDSIDDEAVEKLEDEDEDARERSLHCDYSLPVVTE